VEVARSLLSPASLLGEGKAEKDQTFAWAVRTLEDLGLVQVESDHVGLTGPGGDLSVDDVVRFADLLRSAVLAPERNVGIGQGSEQTGPRDLVRGLAWFLCGDPLAAPLGLQEVEQQQQGAFPERVGKLPIANDFRWNRFLYWAPALGLAATAVLHTDSRAQKLICDCTAAVKRTVLRRWSKDQRIDAPVAVAGILEDLPVLPGGRYSRELELPVPAHTVSASLSFALLRGNDQGWISLQRDADAPREVLVIDTDTAAGTRRVTHMTVLGDLDA
jgi:hypothetical protein